MSAVPGEASVGHGTGVPGDRHVGQHAWRQAPDAGRAAREGRARRLLDVLVHQLPADAPPPRGMGSRVSAAGLTIVGVHSPEFAFERVPDNVRAAVKRLGVRYPVALDNDFATWRAYANQYWPAKYLIDRNGRLRFHHFGEGSYEDTERRDSCAARRDGEDAADLGRRVTTPTRAHDARVLPRATSGSRGSRTAGSHPDVEWRVQVPERRAPNDALAYAGRWTVERERIVAGRGARAATAVPGEGRLPRAGGKGRVRRARRRTPLRTVARVGAAPAVHARPVPRVRGRACSSSRFSPGIAGYAFTFG